MKIMWTSRSLCAALLGAAQFACLDIGRTPSVNPDRAFDATPVNDTAPTPDAGVDATVGDRWIVERIVGHTDSRAANRIGAPRAVAVHPITDEVFVAALNQVYRIDDGRPVLVAGAVEAGYSGDGGPATDAQFGVITALEFGPLEDGEHALFIVDHDNAVVRRLDADGTLTRYAGLEPSRVPPLLDACARQEVEAPACRPASGVHRLEAGLCGINDIALDSTGRMYIALGNDRVVWRIESDADPDPARRSTYQWVIDAGSTWPHFTAVEMGPDDDTLYVTNGRDGAMRRVDVSTVPVPAAMHPGPDDTIVGFESVWSMGATVDRRRVYVALGRDHRVVTIDFEQPAGARVTPFAGTGRAESGPAGSPGPETSLLLPSGVAVRADGTVMITEMGGGRLRAFPAQAGVGDVVTGVGPAEDHPERPATAVSLPGLDAILVEDDGDLLLGASTRIVRWHAETNRISTVAGDRLGGPAAERVDIEDATFGHIEDLLPVGDRIYVADGGGNSRVRVIEPGGRVDIVAGNGESVGEIGEGGGPGLDGPALRVPVMAPTGLELYDDRLHIAELWGHRLRRLDPDGMVRIVAGRSDEYDILDDEGVPVGSTNPEKDLRHPYCLVGINLDGMEHLCYGDSQMNPRRFTCFDPATATPRYFPPMICDNGPAAVDGSCPEGGSAILPGQPPLCGHQPGGVNGIVPIGEQIYVSHQHGISEIDRDPDADPAEVFDLVVGDLLAGGRGDGGPFPYARVSNPQDLAVDAGGRLLVLDRGTGRVRRIDWRTRLIDTIAGAVDPPGVGPRAIAWLESPMGLAPAPDGGWLVAGGVGGRLFHVAPDGGGLSVIAGRAAGFTAESWVNAWAMAPDLNPPPRPTARHARLFHDALAVALDAPRAHIYVLERGRATGAMIHRIHVESPSPEAWTIEPVLAMPEWAPRTLTVLDDTLFIGGGENLAGLTLPLAVDAEPAPVPGPWTAIGAMAVADNALWVLDGRRVARWAPGDDVPQAIAGPEFDEPTALAVSNHGEVFVADRGGVWRWLPGDTSPARIETPALDNAIGPDGRQVTSMIWRDGALHAVESTLGRLMALRPVE